MVFTQIIHSQSGSFHSRAHWQSIKSQNSLCWYKRSDMELGRFVWFICSQNPLENSSDHCEQNLPCKELSPPHKQAVSSSPLRSKHRQREPIAAGRYSRAPHPNCFDYRQYVPRHPDKHWRGEAPGLPGHGCIFQHYISTQQADTQPFSLKAFQTLQLSPEDCAAEPAAAHAVTRWSSSTPGY